MNLKVKFLPLAALLLNPLSVASVPAAETAPAVPQPPSMGVTVPEYGAVRVTDIAPLFTLPNANGKLWSLREQLGKSAVLVFLISDSVTARLSGRQLDTSLYAAADQLSKNGVAAVVVLSGVPQVNLKLAAGSALAVLTDSKSELQKLYGSPPSGLTLIAIDKGGFVRRIDAIPHAGVVGARMLRIGDPTPKLEVGQPAPDFSLSDMNGRVRRLSDLRGQKNLLLTFFPKCFTGG